MKTLVLGIGNTILGDDGIGIRTVQHAANIFKNKNDIVIKETSAAGLNLLDIIYSFDRVILVDAILTGKSNVGKIFRLQPDNESSGSVSLHSCSINSTISLLNNMFPENPVKHVVMFAVGISRVNKIRERLSLPVQKAIPELLNLIENELAA